MNWIISIIGFVGGNWSRLVIYGLLILGALSAAAGWGYMKGVERLYVYQGKQATQAIKIITKQLAATQRVVTKYIRVQGKTKIMTETIEKEIIKYEQTNPSNCLDPEWRRLHDSAATNTISPTSARTETKSGTPSAATAIETVTTNYAACHRTADKLDAIQQLWTEQEKITH